MKSWIFAIICCFICVVSSFSSDELAGQLGAMFAAIYCGGCAIQHAAEEGETKWRRSPAA